MPLLDVGARVPFTEDDPFFQTTPPAHLGGDIDAFARDLGGLAVTFVPVEPRPDAETGFCHRNVAECVRLHGGRPAVGYALWANRLFLMAEYHSVWETPTGELIDPTPAAEGETRICFARDPSRATHYDAPRPPPNRAMSIVGKADGAAVSEAIAGLSPARLDYEKRRADRAGLDLDTHMAKKIGRSALSVAVDEFIAASQSRDLLVTQTATRILSHDPPAFRSAQLEVCRLEDRIRRLLATQENDGSDPAPGTRRSVATTTSHSSAAEMRSHATADPKGEVASGASGFDGLIEALLNPDHDMVAIDLAPSGPKVLYAGNLGREARSGNVATDHRAQERLEEVARRIRNLADAEDGPGEPMRAKK